MILTFLKLKQVFIHNLLNFYEIKKAKFQNHCFKLYFFPIHGHVIMCDNFRLASAKWDCTIFEKERLLNSRNIFNMQTGVLLLTELILAFICTVGDYFVFDSLHIINIINQIVGLSERLTRALLDNSAHSLVGIISWFLITYPRWNLYELILSGVVASLIDLDHFISARSFSLLDAISLSSRPFFHNSLILSLANILFLVVILYKAPSRLSVCFLVFIAWFSHHVRDANRRGLWFGPIYTTKPLSDAIYLGIILILPLIMRHALLFHKGSSRFSNSTAVDVDVINYKRDVHIV